MSLELNLLTEQDWVACRTNQPDKLKNSYLIDRFNTAIYSIIDNFVNGSIYYNNIVPYNCISNNSLLYEETSPYINLFSIAPKAYYTQDSSFCDLWKLTDIDSAIIDTFSGIPSSKYKNNELEYPISQNYILFAMQSDSQQLDKNYNKDGIASVLQFAIDNKINIVFKLHPFTNYRTRFLKDLELFKSSNLLSKYSHIVSHKYSTNHLIANADQVWTFSSGVAMQAVIAGKKVSCFSSKHTFGPIVHTVSSPEDAFSSKKIESTDILRFLTWYYHKLCIDLHTDTFKAVLYDRCDKFFNKKLSLEQIFT